jgi:hypothetical protein
VQRITTTLLLKRCYFGSYLAQCHASGYSRQSNGRFRQTFTQSIR